MVPEEVPKHSQKLLRNMANDNSILEETDSESVMGVALLSFRGLYLPNKQPPDPFVEVNAALQGTSFMLCHVYK